MYKVFVDWKMPNIIILVIVRSPQTDERFSAVEIRIPTFLTWHTDKMYMEEKGPSGTPEEK